MALKRLIGLAGILCVVLLLAQGPVAAQPDTVPLEGRALDNVTAFTRLTGYVRYFHPSDPAAAADWDAFTAAGMETVEPAADTGALIAALRDLFAPIAPTVQIYATGDDPPPLPDALNPADKSDLKLTAWLHIGVAGSMPTGYGSERVTKRPDGPPPQALSDFPDPQEPYRADVGGGVTVSVPLALYQDTQGTLPHLPLVQSSALPEPDLAHLPRAVRLAAVATGWNVAQHFYPYFDVVDVDWPGVLSDALQRAALDRDGRALFGTLAWMVTQLQDGHGNVFHPAMQSNAILPVSLDWIEDHVVVTAVDPTADIDLRPGDVVLSIDGRSADEVMAELDDLHFGSTVRGRRYFTLTQYLSLGNMGSAVSFQVQHPDQRFEMVTVPRTATFNPQTAPPRPEKIAELEPGIYYVDLTRISNTDYVTARPDLVNARAVIFDLRGYPIDGDYRQIILPDLTNQDCPYLLYQVPVHVAPDQSRFSFQDIQYQLRSPQSALVTGQVFFLTDERAMSHSEDILGIVINCHIGSIVGSRTYGVDGNVNVITLPGGYRMAWTGMRVTWPDGSQFHNLGIPPTVTVAPTIQGIIDGRDEVLDAALGLARRN